MSEVRRARRRDDSFRARGRPVDSLEAWEEVERREEEERAAKPFVVRVRYIGSFDVPPGLGWLCEDGTCTRAASLAHRYASSAEAWEHAQFNRVIGEDEEGPWAWVENEVTKEKA